MFKKNTGVQHDKFDTIIGTNTMIEGILKDDGTIRIDGEVIGDVVVKGDLFIGESGKITGNITGTNVIVSGKLLGNVEAFKILHITSTGILTGDINVNSIIVDEGAFFKGICKMTNKAENGSINNAE